MHMSDDNGRLSKTVSSQRSVQTDNKSEGEAWEAMVDYSKLSDIEIKIHQKHVAANRVSGLKFYLYTFQSHIVFYIQISARELPRILVSKFSVIFLLLF